MTLTEILIQVGSPADDAQARTLADRLPVSAPADWRHLAVALALDEQRRGNFMLSKGPARVIGLCGGQGAGKTTLANLLVEAFGLVGRRAVSLSLDDFYLGHAERQMLAVEAHPLLATRGVPGTHDVELAIAVLESLRAGRVTQAPVFDKALDDRRLATRHLAAGTEVVIFEGWCVGAEPQLERDLDPPVNELERGEDPQCRWRRFVNQQLATDYARLWALVDELVYLQVPDIDAVIRWRTDQEQNHPLAARMSEAALERFVAHYQRLTEWMASTLPSSADIIGILDEKHRLKGIRRNRQGPST